jgi:hypothetical protein
MKRGVGMSYVLKITWLNKSMVQEVGTDNQLLISITTLVKS